MITNQGDAQYHQRHNRRSLRRAQRISKYIQDGEKILDVGCNRGVISEYLLENNNPKLIKGIEISEIQPSEHLNSNKKFSFSREDICHSDIDLFDSVIYGAVHHHIVRENGLGKSIEVLQKLAENCRKQIFFETGELKEGGRWQWQRSIREYFRSDEEHIYFLLNAIRPHIDDVDVIGNFFIHGFPRSLLRIKLKPFAQRKDLKKKASATNKRTSLNHFVAQKTNKTKSIDLRMKTGLIEFSETPTENSAFCKGRPFFPWVSEDEFLISSQIDKLWAIKPYNKPEDGVLKFPFIRGLSIYEVPRENRKEVADALINIHSEAKNLVIKAPKSLLDRELSQRKLYNCIDMNPNNFIIEYKKNKFYVYVCDFEPQPNDQCWKNKINEARSLRILRKKRLRMIKSYVEGACLLIAQCTISQFKRRKTRFITSQPSLLSIVVTETTSFLGTKIARTLPFLSEK